MQIKEIFIDFAGKITNIELYQRAVKKNAQNELIKLNEYAEQLEKKPEFKEYSYALDRMFFSSAFDGKLRDFGHKKSSVEDRARSVYLHKNKQYQWLVAEAYEEFEDYVERAYAYHGFVDKNSWPLSDYGSTTLQELERKDFDYFLNQSRNKRNIPQSILSQFRKTLPRLSPIETDNKLNISLKFAITFVELLRHIIVHRSGIVSDKNKFIENVVRKSGLYNNGNPKQEYIDTIKNYFGTDKYENHVLLLESSVSQDLPIEMYVSRFQIIIGYLMSYAHVLYELLKKYDSA